MKQKKEKIHKPSPPRPLYAPTPGWRRMEEEGEAGQGGVYKGVVAQQRIDVGVK